MANTTQEVRKADIGTVFRFTVKDGDDSVDISSATTQEVCFRKPDNTVITKTTSFTNSGTDGKLQYTTVSGDIDQDGPWSAQVHLVLTSGTFRSTWYNFNVGANICTT